MKLFVLRFGLCTAALLSFQPQVVAQGSGGGPTSGSLQVVERPTGEIVATDGQDVHLFGSWTEYAHSPLFRRHEKRCGTGQVFPLLQAFGPQFASQADCSSTTTNPSSIYAPSVARYRIPVVVHVIMNTSGSGAISDPMIQSQIDILNEDFLALPGSNGAPGTDAQVEFYLAGVTRTTNNTWFNDGGSYWTTLAWDPLNYLNIYTNTASGNLGYAYVPSGGGVVGNSWDRVVILWSSFGRNAPIGPPYDQGRTTTHEVGHYLGLYHTFDGGCGSVSACYTTADLICDTLPESTPNFGCSQTTCGDPDPVTNYMDYSEDLCMNNFTSEQARRMRCTLEAWRVDVYEVVSSNPPGQVSNPSPSSGATGVSNAPTLSWSAGSGATSYDVYFGTDSTPDSTEFIGNQAGTTFVPGALAASTTFYWAVDARNSAGVTAGPVWSFTTQSGGATVSLFTDGFESGNLTAGGWTTQNTNSFASTGSANAGAWGARVRRSSWMQKTLSTAGYNSIHLKYARRTVGMDASENLYVEWYSGTVWTAVETTKSTTWASQDLALPAGAAGNSAFRIRFRTNCSNNNEYASIDSVEVTGVTN